MRDLVTEWDTRAEEHILRRLAELSPGVPVLAEEGGQTGGTSSSDRWLVDPIDGTVNFAHGIPLFAVSLAMERDGRSIAAAVAAPALGWEFAGARGLGATVNEEPMKVSQTSRLDHAMLASGFPYDRATTRHNFAEWEYFQCHARACRRFGAASLDLCMVARGWLDGYWETRLSPWDLAAATLLVEEAGGRVTGITGGPFSADSGEAVASNGAIHDQIVAGLRAVAASRLMRLTTAIVTIAALSWATTARADKAASSGLDVDKVQAMLAVQDLDGWLLVDFKGQNPLAPGARGANASAAATVVLPGTGPGAAGHAGAPQRGRFFRQDLRDQDRVLGSSRSGGRTAQVVARHAPDRHGVRPQVGHSISYARRCRHRGQGQAHRGRSFVVGPAGAADEVSLGAERPGLALRRHAPLESPVQGGR